jgi:hypothetical protein
MKFTVELVLNKELFFFWEKMLKFKFQTISTGVFVCVWDATTIFCTFNGDLFLFCSLVLFCSLYTTCQLTPIGPTTKIVQHWFQGISKPKKVFEPTENWISAKEGVSWEGQIGFDTLSEQMCNLFLSRKLCYLTTQSPERSEATVFWRFLTKVSNQY